MGRATIGTVIRPLFWSLLVGVVAGGAVATRFGTRWPSVYVMTGPSMKATVAAGEYFLAWTPPPTITRGMLVLFRYEEDAEVFHVLRRVAGVPGDTVSMQAGRVFVDGVPQDWPFEILQPSVTHSPLARTGALFDWGPLVVPADSLFLLADVRDNLGWPDSRFIGYVAETDIIAHATNTMRGRRLR